MKRKHPMQQDDVEQAMRLLSRAAKRMEPYGTLLLTLQWLPKQRNARGKTEGNKS